MPTQIEKTKLRTWVELDTSAIKKNWLTFKSLVKPETIIMGVVKSNAYGHGLVPFSQTLVSLGCTYLGVDSFEEALELRKAGIKTRVMVFGYTSPAYYDEAVKKNISLTISNTPALKALSKIKKKIKIHIKADTGLGRQGFFSTERKQIISFLKKHPHIVVEGLYSHLAVGESPDESAYTHMQAERLLEWKVAFVHAGYNPLTHLCASASTMLYPQFHFDMVRIGISMYGLWASKDVYKAMKRKITLYPVLSWKTIVTEIKSIPKGIKIGYDLTEALKRDSKLAIIPVGYWHGYPRLLSSKGTFSVRGQRVKIIGRVSMDMCVIDVTDVPGVRVGDEVAIIGGDNKHYAEADMMAQDSETINYEITTRINPIIKRFYRINPTITRFLK